jgi:hypothetical protein
MPFPLRIDTIRKSIATPINLNEIEDQLSSYPKKSNGN